MADKKIVLIIIAIVVLVLIAAGFVLYLYNFESKADLFESKSGSELKEAYSALAKIKSIGIANSLIKAEVGLPRANQEQKSQSKEFSLKIASSTRFLNNSSLEQLKPGDLIYIESRENILNPEFNSLTLTSLQKIETLSKITINNNE